MKRLVLACLLATTALSSTTVSAQSDSIEGRPQSAKVALSLAQQQNYGQAIRQYEQIIQTNPSAINLYNLGVCYNEVGRTKDAIIAYEKALLLNPSLKEARHNVRLAYASTKDAFSDGRSFSWLDDFCYSLKLSTLKALACFFFMLLVISVLSLWGCRRKGLVLKSQIIFGFGIAVLILWVLSLSMVAHQIYYHKMSMKRAIMNQTQELKSSYEEQGNPIETLHEGTAIFILGKQTEPIQEVRLADGRKGYLPSSTFTPIVPNSTQAE